MDVDVEEYVDSFKSTLMDVVYRWARSPLLLRFTSHRIACVC